MIKERQPVNMGEVNDLLKGIKETDKVKETKSYIKKFAKISPEKAKELKEDLKALNIIKIRDWDIVKIIDVIPENSAELNKIFTEVTLDADETTKILETIKKHK